MVPFVSALKAEFASLLQAIVANERTPATCLYHSIDWIHLLALMDAIEELPQRVRARFGHEVILLFDVGCDEDGVVHDQKRFEQARLALSRLSNSRNIRLHPSCESHRRALLHASPSREQPADGVLSIAPFFLGNWGSDGPTRIGLSSTGVVRSVLAYAGEPRVEKGFLRLPTTIKNLRTIFGHELRITVHSSKSLSCKRPPLEAVCSKLLALRGRGLVELAEGVCSAAGFRRLVGQHDLLVLDYDLQAYRHKTSGLLWLAASLGVSVAVTEGSWLQAEAERLELPHVLIRGEQFSAVCDSFRAQSSAQMNAYARQLFASFEDWLTHLVLRNHAT
jgi:hypothetical protein